MREKRRGLAGGLILMAAVLVGLLVLKSCGDRSAKQGSFYDDVSAYSVEFGDQNTVFLGKLNAVDFNETTPKSELDSLKTELKKLKNAAAKFQNLHPPNHYKEANDLFQAGAQRYLTGIAKMERAIAQFEKDKDKNAFLGAKKETQEEFSYGMQDFYNAIVTLEKTRSAREKAGQ